MSGLLRTSLVFCVLSMVLVGSSWGQEERPNPLAPGAWALEFGIGPNFTLTTFNGATISIKRQSSERTALRAGLTVEVRSTEENFTIGDTLGYRTEADRDAYGVALGLDWLRYFRPKARWSLFAGFGPSVSWNHVKESSSYQATGNSGAQLVSGNGWVVGVNGIFGGEWFVAQAIGIHAEYRLGAGYSTFTTESERFSADFQNVLETLQTRESNGWAVGPGFVRFGLSAYF